MADPLISFSGIASGIDSKSIVSALVAFRARPISLLENRRADFQLLKSRYSSLQAGLNTLRDAAADIKKAKDFLEFKATSSNANAVTASPDGSAAAGAITIKVNALAKAEIEKSGGYANFDTDDVGTGDITIDVGGTLNTIELHDNPTNTLQDVRDAINDADIGVTAQIINTGIGTNKYQLLVTADKTGVENAITIDTTTSFTGSLAFTTQVAAANADVLVNGINFQRDTNSIDDIVTGVKFELTNTTTGTETITVSTDLDKIKEKITKYVSAHTDVINYINSQIEVSTAGKGGPFNGESAVRTLKSSLLALSGEATFPGGSLSALADVGLSLNSDGTLNFNAGKFDEAALENLDDVTALLTTKGDFFKGDVGFEVTEVPESIIGGAYAVSITQAATKATGSAATAFTGPLAQAEVLTINVGANDPVTVELEAGATLADAIKSINKALAAKDIQFTAKDDGSGKLEFNAGDYGSAYTFNISSNVTTGGTGIDGSGVSGTGLDVIGTIDGKAATGEGRFLSGTADGVLGIKIKYTGSSPGNSTLTVGPDGFFVRAEELLSKVLAPIDGKIEGRLDAIDDSIASINTRIDSLNGRLDIYKKQLEARFASLEQLLGTLQTSQSFLAISQAQLNSKK